MYKPVFPYLGNQAIMSSGRVTIHSSDDFIFNFGKKGIALSTPSTVTMDVGEKVIVASPRIELGYNETSLEPLLLGDTTVRQLGLLLDSISSLADALSKMSSTQLEVSIPLIITASTTLKEQARSVKAQLEVNCKSKTSFTT